VPTSLRATPAGAFRHVTSLRHLSKVFEDRVAKGSVRGRDGLSVEAVRADLPAVVRYVSRRYRDGTYRFTPYRQRLFLKGAGTAPREISIPTVRDRIGLRALADLLVTLFPDSSGKLPQTGVADAMEALRPGTYDTFVRIDVRKFYPSIDHDILMEQLGSRIKKPQILRLIRRAIMTPTAPDRAARPKALLTTGVPQGLSISNLLAEVYIQPVDRAMSTYPGVSYHRFVDDILILCSSGDADAVDTRCREELAAIKLDAHARSAGGKSDVGNVADGINYLGYVMRPNHMSVRRSSIVQLESHLASIHASWRRDIAHGMDSTLAGQRFGWHRNLAITGCVFEGVASGWIQYFRQLDDLPLLKRLDATVDRLAARYGTPTSPARKTFMRAYWAIRHPRSRSHTYIPNFDLYGPAEMASELRSMGTDTGGWPSSKIQDEFYRVVRKAVRDLERDIGNIS